MKILWISGARVVGGAERVTLQILALLAARGHEIAALLSDGPSLEASAARQIPCRLAPLGRALDVRAVGAIRRALVSGAPDVALVTTSADWVWSCLAQARRTRTRLVLVRHMALPLPPMVCWLAERRADAIVAVSEAAREALLRGGIVSPERVRVIANPVRFTPRDSVPTAEERHAARRSLGLRADAAWVGFFGGTDSAKGLRDVLVACGEARRTVPDLALLVCGRGDAHEVAELAKSFAGEVRFLGETERVADAMTASELIVLATSSRLAEAAPLTALEAMTCGTPLAAYATGGLAELVGATARLAEPDDPAALAREIVAALRDSAATGRLAAAALDRVREGADPALAAERYEHLLEQVVARR